MGPPLKRICFLAVAILLAATALVADAAAVEWVQVKWVADGDTITILDSRNNQHKIRFHGIDTPERGQPYGNAAREALSDMVAGKTVGIVVVDTDRYGRTVGRVYVDGRDVNLAMVEQGFAWWYRRFAPNDRALEAAERSAREGKLGLWREPDPIPPWDWRRSRL